MFTLPDLPYDCAALEPFIDTETMRIHHDGHHGAYVKNLNEALENYPNLQKLKVEELLQTLDKLPEEIRIKIRNNAGGHYNHSLFWQILSPDKGQTPEGKLLQAINTSFGSFDTFKEKFTQVGMGRFGSGWVWLINNSGNLEIMDTPNQDNLISSGKFPVLGLDVWEHAYYLKYKNKRADYIAAWWNVVNWKGILYNFESRSRFPGHL